MTPDLQINRYIYVYMAFLAQTFQDVPACITYIALEYFETHLNVISAGASFEIPSLKLESRLKIHDDCKECCDDESASTNGPIWCSCCLKEKQMWFTFTIGAGR